LNLYFVLMVVTLYQRVGNGDGSGDGSAGNPEAGGYSDIDAQSEAESAATWPQ
jgi:hypothetical protein